MKKSWIWAVKYERNTSLDEKRGCIAAPFFSQGRQIEFAIRMNINNGL